MNVFAVMEIYRVVGGWIFDGSRTPLHIQSDERKS